MNRIVVVLIESAKRSLFTHTFSSCFCSYSLCSCVLRFQNLIIAILSLTKRTIIRAAAI
jgi:hypothetical protein